MNYKGCRVSSKGKKRYGKDLVVMGLIAIPSVLISALMQFGLTQDREIADVQAQEDLYSIVAEIEEEKLSLPNAVPLNETNAIKNLQQAYTYADRSEVSELDTQYIASANAQTDDYCLLVKDPDGVDSRAGYVYSFAEDEIQKYADTDCSLDSSAHVSGPQKDINSEINGFVEYGPWGLAVIFTTGGYLVYAGRESNQPAPPASTAVLAGDDPNSRLRARLDKVLEQWSEYETDPVKILDYPMVSNMSFAPTSHFHLALRQAREAFAEESSVETLTTSVVALEHSYEVMINEAQRVKWNSFSVEEKKHLRTAQQLLNMALDSSSSVNERNLAYKKLLKEVEGIISLSPATILAIEEKSLLRIS